MRSTRIWAHTATLRDYQAEIAAQECEVAAAVEEKEEIDNNLKASETRQAEYEKELEECKEKLAAEQSPAAIVKLELKKEGLEADIVLQTIKQRSLREQKDRLATRITEFDALKQRLGARRERAARPCLSLPVTRLVLCANAYCAAFKRLLSLFFFCSGFEQSHTHTHTHTHTRTLAHASHTLFPFLCTVVPSSLPSPKPQPPPPRFCFTTERAKGWKAASSVDDIHRTSSHVGSTRFVIAQTTDLLSFSFLFCPSLSPLTPLYAHL